MMQLLRFRTKLALLAGIPVLGALILALMIVQTARENARTAEAIGSIEDLAELSERMRTVTSALQGERARSAWALGGKLTVADETSQERVTTDHAVKRLKEFVEARDPAKLPPRLARELGPALEQLSQLERFRSEIEAGTVPLGRQLDFYSEPVLSLIGATAALTELSTDASLLRSISSLASTMEVKERQSLEHALLVHVFALGEYPVGIFRRFVTLDTEEQVHTAWLLRSASERHRELFERALKSPEAQNAAAMKRVALKSTENETSTDAREWYTSQARLVDDLGGVERELGVLVRQAAVSKIREARQAIRIGSGLTAGVLLVSLVLAGLIGRGITRTLGALAAAAQRVRSEHDFSVRATKTTNDEIGILTDAFNEMLEEIQNRDRELEQHRAGLERLVDERTRELSSRNAAMRLVLDNVAQGLATTDTSGKIASERSAAFDRWFGASDPEVSFATHLAGGVQHVQETMQLAFDQVCEGFLPLEVSLDMLPKRIERDHKHFSVEYAPLLRDQQLDGLLLMVTDITAQVHAERAEIEQRELIRAFQHVLKDRGAFLQFMSDARAQVEQIRNDHFVDAVERRRCVHTLKGNASLFALDSVVLAAHELEHTLDEDEIEQVVQRRQALVDSWTHFSSQLLPLLGGDLGHHVEITRAELDELLTTIRQGAARGQLETMVARLAFEPTRTRFNRIATHISALAKRLKKSEPVVVVKDNGVRLPPERFAPLWSAFSHLIRNIVDHALEDPESRLEKGKPARAQVTLSARSGPEKLTLVVEDDGKGIDWQLVRAKARASGLPHESRHDLVAALVSPRFSTASSVTQTSGRGVGLCAVASAVTDLGGHLSIESEYGRGTRFTFAFEGKDATFGATAG